MEPTSGAITIAAAASEPEAACGRAIRRASAVVKADSPRDPSDRHDNDPPGSVVSCHVRIDVVEQPDVWRGQHVIGRASRQHLAVLQQDQRAAQTRGEIQIVRRHGDRRVAHALAFAQQLAEFELIREIERDRRLIEQENAVTRPRRQSARGLPRQSRAVFRRR